jgi:hypothetical protein
MTKSIKHYLRLPAKMLQPPLDAHDQGNACLELWTLYSLCDCRKLFLVPLVKIKLSEEVRSGGSRLCNSLSLLLHFAAGFSSAAIRKRIS